MSKKEAGRSRHWIALNQVLDIVLPTASLSIYLTNEILHSLGNAIAWLVAAGVPDGSQDEILTRVFKNIRGMEDEHRQNIEDHRIMRSREPKNKN